MAEYRIDANPHHNCTELGSYTWPQELDQSDLAGALAAVLHQAMIETLGLELSSLPAVLTVMQQVLASEDGSAPFYLVEPDYDPATSETEPSISATRPQDPVPDGNAGAVGYVAGAVGYVAGATFTIYSVWYRPSEKTVDGEPNFGFGPSSDGTPDETNKYENYWLSWKPLVLNGDLRLLLDLCDKEQLIAAILRADALGTSIRGYLPTLAG